jgi:hypothetical protein
MADLNGNEQRILVSSILGADGHVFDPVPYERRINHATAADDPMWARNGKASDE